MNDWEDNHHHWEEQMIGSTESMHETAHESLMNDITYFEERNRIMENMESRNEMPFMEDSSLNSPVLEDEIPVFHAQQHNQQEGVKPLHQWVKIIFSVLILIFVFTSFFAHLFFGNG